MLFFLGQQWARLPRETSFFVSDVEYSILFGWNHHSGFNVSAFASTIDLLLAPMQRRQIPPSPRNPQSQFEQLPFPYSRPLQSHHPVHAKTTPAWAQTNTRLSLSVDPGHLRRLTRPPIHPLQSISFSFSFSSRHQLDTCVRTWGRAEWAWDKCK